MISVIGTVMMQKISVRGVAVLSPWLEGVRNSSEVCTLWVRVSSWISCLRAMEPAPPCGVGRGTLLLASTRVIITAWNILTLRLRKGFLRREFFWPMCVWSIRNWRVNPLCHPVGPGGPTGWPV